MLKANVSVWPFPLGLRMLNMHEGQGRREEQSCQTTTSIPCSFPSPSVPCSQFPGLWSLCSLTSKTGTSPKYSREDKALGTALGLKPNQIKNMVITFVHIELNPD